MGPFPPSHKKMQPVLGFLAIVIILGCGSDDCTLRPERILEVHLQTGFVDTPVRVEVDETLVLDARITTGTVLAFAAIVPVAVNDTRHLLGVQVDSLAIAVTEILVSETPYVGVCYDEAERAVTFVPSAQPFVYR